MKEIYLLLFFLRLQQLQILLLDLDCLVDNGGRAMKDDSISRKTVINGLDYIIIELDKLIEEDPLNNEYHHTKKQVKEIKNGV